MAVDSAWVHAIVQKAPGGVNCGNAGLAAADHYLSMRRGESVLGPGYAPYSYGLR